MVAHIAGGGEFGVGLAPCFGGLAEDGDVEQVGFIGIDEPWTALGGFELR